MLRVRAKYPPGICSHDEYNEVRLDLSGCNLNCSFCWSPASRPSETGDPARNVTAEEVVSSIVGNIGDRSRTFIRFTGGEPTLQWSGIMDVVRLLQSSIDPPRPAILFQTNGIEIGEGRAPLDSLSEFHGQRFLFELSLKGTNPSEFALLAGKSADLYECQLSGYQRLLELSQAESHIRVVAVLGVYHSSIARPSRYAFADPSSGQLLFDAENLWDSRFSALWRSAPCRWVERLRMSPRGCWESILSRCGPKGNGVIRYFPNGAMTNPNGSFPGKPRAVEYARRIVAGTFWS